MAMANIRREVTIITVTITKESKRKSVINIKEYAPDNESAPTASESRKAKREKATALLKKGEMKQTDIAKAVGFSNGTISKIKAKMTVK